MTVSIMYEMTRTCGSIVVTWSLGDAYQSMRHMTFSLSVTAMLVEATLAPKRPPVRFWNLVFIGLLYLKILTIFAKVVTGAKGLGRFHLGTRCPSNQSWCAKSSMCGESTSWVHFLTRLGTSISLWHVTMSPNWWRQRLQSLIMLR